MYTKLMPLNKNELRVDPHTSSTWPRQLSRIKWHQTHQSIVCNTSFPSVAQNIYYHRPCNVSQWTRRKHPLHQLHHNHHRSSLSCLYIYTALWFIHFGLNDAANAHVTPWAKPSTVLRFSCWKCKLNIIYIQSRPGMQNCKK